MQAPSQSYVQSAISSRQRSLARSVLPESTVRFLPRVFKNAFCLSIKTRVVPQNALLALPVRLALLPQVLLKLVRRVKLRFMALRIAQQWTLVSSHLQIKWLRRRVLQALTRAVTARPNANYAMRVLRAQARPHRAKLNVVPIPAPSRPLAALHATRTTQATFQARALTTKWSQLQMATTRLLAPPLQLNVTPVNRARQLESSLRAR